MLSDTPDPYVKLFSSPAGAIANKKGKPPKTGSVTDKTEHVCVPLVLGLSGADWD